jgi:hypothetical protein
MQDERIIKVLEFVNMLEQQEAQDRQMISSDIHAESDVINSETQGSFENMEKQTLQEMQMGAQQPFNQGGNYGE